MGLKVLVSLYFHMLWCAGVHAGLLDTPLLSWTNLYSLLDCLSHTSRTRTMSVCLLKFCVPLHKVSSIFGTPSIGMQQLSGT